MKFFRLPVIVGALPITLTNGTTADATQVMSDLNWIVNQVNANAAPLLNTALTNANNNFTVIQSGQAATQPANFPIASQVQNESFNTLSSALGTNVMTSRVAALALSAYANGQTFRFLPPQINSGDTTMSIDGLSAKHFLNAGSALSGGELRPLIPVEFFYDSGRDAFPLINGTPFVKGPNIPSIATLNLDALEGDYHQIDGTVAITAMTLSRGRSKWLEFTSSPVMTSGASLLLQGSSNFKPKSSDVIAVRGEAGGVVREVARYYGSVRTPALALIASATAANSASLTFTSGIGDDYDEYELHFSDLIPATDGSSLGIQVSEDGGATYKSGATDYRVAINAFSSAAVASTATGAQVRVPLSIGANGQRNAATSGMDGVIRFYRPSSAVNVKNFVGQVTCEESTTTEMLRMEIAGRYQATTNPINAIRVSSSAGNITSGSVYLYGVRKQ